jgi:hypothetical protein
MNEKEFLTKVIKQYHQARKPVFPNSKIRRGRSHSVSSAVEDLFALYLTDHIDCDLIYIDQPLSIEGHKVQIYPDIAIVKKSKITAMCDIKMDLGWKRNELYDFCKRHAALLAKVRGKKCKIRDGQTKEDLFYRISTTASLNIVIISDQNISSKILNDHLIKIKPFQKLVRVFILTKGEHPNTYGITTQELLKEILINKDVFNSLIKKLS